MTRTLVLIFSLGCVSFLSADPSLVIRLRIFPQTAKIFVDGTPAPSTPENSTIRDVSLPNGTARVSFTAFGWRPLSAKIPAQVLSGAVWSLKLEPLGSFLRQAAEFRVGTKPRALAFSSDSSEIAVATSDGLLAYSASGQALPSLTQAGFFSDVTEVPSIHEIWALKDDGSLFFLDAATLKLKSKTSWGGTGNGSLALIDPSHMAVLSWDQESLASVGLATHQVGQPQDLADMTTSAAALPASSGGGWAVSEFQQGNIDWFDAQGHPAGSTRIGGSPRALATAGTLLWVANMATGTLTALDLGTRKPSLSVDVGPNPQTLVLSPDGKILAVALRGTNNPQDYTKPGPDFGKIIFLDPQTGKILGYVWGREQPMGLAWSPDSRFVAFTDYLSNDVEVYRVNH